jgi:hypothetical protein
MTIQQKVAKKTIETLNDFYGHVYRLSPSVMFILLTLLLFINGIIKYSHTKNILDCVYLEIPFVFLKKLFGLGNEFDYLMLSKKEKKEANTLIAMKNIYKKYIKNKIDLNKAETIVANIDLLSDQDKPIENIEKLVSKKYLKSIDKADDLSQPKTGLVSVDLSEEPDNLKKKEETQAINGGEDNKAIDAINQAIDVENQAINDKSLNEKDMKFLKLYLQFFVHFFFTVISLLILFIQILIPVHEIKNECKPGYSCFKILNKARESFNCSSINSGDKVNYVCQKHELETFSEFLTDIGAFSGLIALIFKMHSYTLTIFIAVKSKLRNLKKSKSSNESSKSCCKISYKCEIILFVTVIIIELLFLISILVFHAISEQLMIEFLEEEYLVYGCLFISLLLTANSIEKRLFKANQSSKFEMPSEATDAAKSLVKNNFMKNANILF